MAKVLKDKDPQAEYEKQEVERLNHMAETAKKSGYVIPVPSDEPDDEEEEEE